MRKNGFQIYTILAGLFLLLTSNLLFAQSSDIYQSVQIGSFSVFNIEDYKDLRSLGYVYTDPLDNGMTRVLLGGFSNKNRAETALKQVKSKGYPEAFLNTKMINKGGLTSVVQLATFASNATINWARFLNVGDIYTIADGNKVKIISGSFSDAVQVQQRLTKAKQMGFSEAFVKQVHPSVLHWVNSYETGGLNQSQIAVVEMKPEQYDRALAYTQPSNIPTSYDAPPSAEFTARGGTTNSSLRSIPRAGNTSTLVAIKTYRRPTNTPVKRVETFAPKSAPTTPSIKRSAAPKVHIKSKRTSVVFLQKLLKENGTYTSSIDGVYGAKSYKAYQDVLGKNKSLKKYILAVQAESNSFFNDCRDWEVVRLLQAIAQDIDDFSSNSNAHESELKALFHKPEFMDANKVQIIVSWDYRFRRGLDKWAATDPLRAEVADALKIAYLQSQIQLEDHFSKKGKSNTQAKALAMSCLKNMVGHNLERFEGM